MSLFLPGDASPRARVALAGVKSSKTTGTIAAGSNLLTVTSKVGFAVNDNIIVELGGEASGGRPGSPGVGGVWPTLAYANEAAMNADASQAQNTYCYCIGSGTVYRWDHALRWVSNPNNTPYWNSAVPRALLARITRIVGNMLTLDTSASVASTNANVYFDNTPVFNAAARAAAGATTLVWPDGAYACGSTLMVAGQSYPTIIKKVGMRVTGSGQMLTTLFSPKGVICAGLEFRYCAQGEVSNLNFFGHAGLYGANSLDLRFATSVLPPQWNSSVFLESCDKINVIDCHFKYCWRWVVGLYATNCTAHRIIGFSDVDLSYIQWKMTWANCSYCNSYDCKSTSTYVTKTFHIFASNHCGHIRPTTHNGVYGLNSTGDCVIDTPTATFAANSRYSQVSIPIPGTYVFDINTNIRQNEGQGGNKVLNMNVSFAGYLDTADNVFIGANISGRSRDTLISGGRYSAPDFRGGNAQAGQAVNSDSGVRNTMVSGLTVVGKGRDGGIYRISNWSNIYVANGRVTNCVADSISCVGPSCSESGNQVAQVTHASFSLESGRPS
jgi:hypothetical protein